MTAAIVWVLFLGDGPATNSQLFDTADKCNRAAGMMNTYNNKDTGTYWHCVPYMTGGQK